MYISNAFEAKRAALLVEDPTAAEDPDEYLAENLFWVPKEARWSHLQDNAKQPTIGKLATPHWPSQGIALDSMMSGLRVS
jgi:type I restriction enzyme M protein